MVRRTRTSKTEAVVAAECEKIRLEALESKRLRDEHAKGGVHDRLDTDRDSVRGKKS